MNTVSLVDNIRHSLMNFSMLTILKALLIAIVGFVICKLLIKGLKKLLASKNVSPRISGIVITSTRICLGTALVIIVFSELGINTSSILVILAVCLLVLFFAAQDILNNVASGLVMTSTNLFKKGDVVCIDSHEGEVYETFLNCTKLKCYDGEIVTIPNKVIANSKVINYSVINARRAHITILASYENETDSVMDICRKVIDSSQGVLHDNEPRMFISRYINSNLEYSFYFWVSPDCRNYTEQEVTGNIYRQFKKEGILISHPGITIDNPAARNTEA